MEKKKKSLVAQYHLFDEWDFDAILDEDETFDLDNAHAYWVMWGTLYVEQTEGGEIKEYLPTYSAEDDTEGFKRPVDLSLV